jgi:hypothetical protein
MNRGALCRTIQKALDVRFYNVVHLLLLDRSPKFV